MPEVTAAELKKLRALESRIVSANETVGELREKRNELQAGLTAARREVRSANRDSASLRKQIDELVAENRRLATALEAAVGDLGRVGEEATALREQRAELRATLKTTRATVAEARKSATTAERARARLEKQLRAVTEQLKGVEPPEVTPEHLSELLQVFIKTVGRDTGLTLTSGRVNLKVGFSGRGGGTFVLPAVGVDASKIPELHEIQLDLAGIAPVVADR